MFLVDSHCHLDMLDLKPEDGDLNKFMQRAKENNIKHILNVCTRIMDFEKVVQTAEKYSWVSASVGLHPNEQEEEVDAQRLIELAAHPKVVAIGETGLDYFRSTGDVEWQRTRFRAHIDAAKKINKPLIIHTRNAKEDTLRIMRENRAHEIGGVMHCFSEDLETAKLAMDLNFYISFSGVVTFKNAQVLQEVAKHIPLDRILIETDAPYLAPIPHRGKPNEPAYVYHTAEFIANLREIPLEEFAEQTTQNFFRLFQGAEQPHV